MLPIGNNLTPQFLADVYASSAHYASEYYYVPEDALPFWDPIKYADNNDANLLHSLPEPALLAAQDPPTKTQQKTTRPRQKVDKESSVSCRSGDESSEMDLNFKLRQKYGRNINSNIFIHMSKRISSEAEYLGLMEKIVTRERTEMGVEEFLEMLNKKMSKLRTYVSMKKIKELWKGPKPRLGKTETAIAKERQFCKIFRTLCRYYLKNNHVVHVFNVLKVKKESKNLHVAGSRKLLELMD
jgi:hypothetical protein